MKPVFTTKLILWLAILCGLAAATPASAQQVPQLLNYQGRVTAAGVNFDGPGLFKFALVNGDGTTTYWSNDGSSSSGSQPTGLAVQLPVKGGLYSVLLGDSAIANMTAFPPDVFGHPDVRLRVWFSDGTHGSQLLAPDQRITAVGYALTAGSAATVASGVVTAASIAPAAVGSSQLASNVSQALVPPGTILPFGGTAVPTGYLLCDGSALKSADYPNLFAAISTNWGNGTDAPAGTATGGENGRDFNLPDLRGRFLRGVDAGSQRDPDVAARSSSITGGSSGNNVGSTQADAFKAHVHTSTTRIGYDQGAGSYHGSEWKQDTNRNETITSAPTGDSETRPKNVYVNYIIKY